MCGICGIWYFDRNHPVDPKLIQAMTARLVHRGPDEAGFYSTGSLALGVRRLNIIDAELSHQPIANEDEQLHLVCNGEIYNFHSLRRELSTRHQFRTQGDVETILHCYEDSGLHCVDHLRGMFAFALWDSRAARLTLAVDRFGKKPLYYLHDAEKIVFASELKALLCYPGFQREMDYEALDQYFACGYITAPRTIYRRVRKFAPGQVMTVECDGLMRIDQYWQPSFAEPGRWRKDSLADLTDELRGLLVEAVRLRMTSDAPLGAFLSGGVDSTAVVALMRHLGGAPIRTFSVGFDDSVYDERGYAQAAADYFQTEHVLQVVREQDALELLPSLVQHFDEPFADSSMLPTYLVSQLACESVTVALSGDGGDEVFGGYHQHLYGYRQHWLQSIIPASLHPGAVHLAPYTAKLRPYVASLDRSPQHWLSSGFFSSEQRRRLYKVETREALAGYEGEQVKREAFGRVTRHDPVSQLQYYDLTVYLPGDILVKVDRASMFASLEVRSPLLDHTLFEFMARVPPRFRVRLTGGKFLLKRALAPFLPPFIWHRKKQGFSIPQAEWLRGALYPLLSEVLADAVLTELFNSAYLLQLVEQHSAGQVDHKDRLWALLCFGLWARTGL